MRNIIVVILLSLLVCGDAKYQNGADHLVNCFDRMSKISAITKTSDLLTLVNQCVDAYVHYSNDKIQLGPEIWSIAKATKGKVTETLIEEAKQYVLEFGIKVLDKVDDDTKHRIIQVLEEGDRAYRLFSNVLYGKAETALIRNSVEKLTFTGLLFNPATTKATKWAGTMIKYSSYVGIGADVTEYALEKMGYETQGRTIGALGNTVSGAMTGFAIAGPVGGAFGGGLGLLMWWK